ncbi:MAG TPA: biotin--[acetyl-CoA-carboxylase] ligase [Chitinophagaceae bacterium]|nr:biotin--[acetyl-CoA-carboxylase] ligase [Chitinophagaceae bacterium]
MPLPFAGNPIGWPFIELQSIDSTNKYAMGLVHGDLLPDGQDEIQHGMVIFTHEQTAGKGQRGKNWVSEKSSNIVLSILLNPYPLSIPDQFRLSVCIAVSVYDLFSKYAGDETKIKWPNDLYWRDRKAGGILIENVVQNSQSAAGSRWLSGWQWAIIGIGINIKQSIFSEDLPNPASLKQITGKNFEPVELAKELCRIIEKNYQLLITGNFEILFTKYQTHLYKKDERVKLKKDTRVFETTIKGVAETGQLITQHSIEERFEFGEIEWIL